MLTIRGKQSQLEQLNNALNIHYGYPNESTKTLTYSQIQTEWNSGELCLMILAADRAFAENIEGIIIEDGNTIKTEPISTMEEQSTAPVVEEQPAIAPEMLN